MGSSATIAGTLSAAVSAVCERFVLPTLRGTPDSSRQARLIGVLLAAPFGAAGALALQLPPLVGGTATLAVVCACFVVAWSIALLVSLTGCDKAAAALALGAGGLALALVVGSAGGAVSPVALLVMALPFEAWWVSRRHASTVAASAAALFALLLQAPAAAALFSGDIAVQPWQWLAPLLYGLTAVVRLQPVSARESSAGAGSLESVIQAVVIRMSAAGEVLEASEKVRDILGLPEELLLSSGLFDRIHLADRVAYLSALADMRESARGRRVELRIRLPQADKGALADNYRPFEIEFAKTAAAADQFVAIIRDNAATAELRESLAMAVEAADGIDVTKSRFLAAVSHELRTPLNAIIGFSDMMLHDMCGALGDPRQKEYVGLIRDSGQHLLGVVNSILDVSKIESGAYAIQPEPFRFRDAVDMCHAMMRLQAEAKHVTLSIQAAATLGEINADRRAVQQMLINLVSNAVKFTPDGGTVVVGANRIGSRLHFWVSDTGIGVAEQDLARLGQPFMQVQNDYTRCFEGTGLGLSLVKGLVGLHGGTMSIESTPGKGTVVSISLPVLGPANGARVELLPLPRARHTEDSHGAYRKAS